MPRQSNAEIGVFGDIERVPSARGPEQIGAEMVRCAAERQGCAEHFQNGKRAEELCVVLDGEHPCQPVLPAVVNKQRRLNAGQSFAAGQKLLESLAQLQPVRPVLRVVDDREFAAAQRQRQQLKNPPIDVDRYLDILLRQGLTQTVKGLAGFRGVL